MEQNRPGTRGALSKRHALSMAREPARPEGRSITMLSGEAAQKKGRLFPHEMRSFKHARPRAQRLSASTNEPLLKSMYGKWGQKCSTPFGINERTTASAGRVVDGDLQCSTPFGINERTTSM